MGEKSSYGLGLQHGLAWMGKGAPEILGVSSIMFFNMAPVPALNTRSEDRPLGKWGTGTGCCCLALKRQSLKGATFYSAQGQMLTPLDVHLGFQTDSFS